MCPSCAFFWERLVTAGSSYPILQPLQPPSSNLRKRDGTFEAYALPNQEADTVAQAVMDNFVCRFGCPLGVLSDRGRNFESRLFRGLCDLIESVKQRTTPYHPQCDGGAERLIRTVTSVISKIAEEPED